MNKFLAALAATGLLSVAGAAYAGPTLDAVKQRGVRCGVSGSVAGFSATDSQGRFSGIDVDYCKALAAAITGDANKVTFIPLSAQARFTGLQSGEVDLLSRNTTWTLTRDASLGAHFSGVWFYDGQGFMVTRKLGVKSAKELNGATVCVQPGTTTELNLADYFRAENMKFQPVVIESAEELNKAFFTGRCDALTTDASGLAAVRSTQPNPDDYVILPEIISKEPLGPMIRRGDDEWFAITKWVLYATLEAEEKGVTSANVDEMAKTSKDPVIQRLLGTTGDMGAKLGLSNDWAHKMIKQVGNYAEIYDRNVGPKTPLKLERGVNALWTKGGLMYAPPIR